MVGTAGEALSTARTQRVALWIINTALPHLNGCELCSMLKAQFPAVPVYLVADEHSPDLERAAWAARASMFGCKPNHLQWLSQWLELRHDRAAPCFAGPRSVPPAASV
jgi:DNA-binding response OmpR family regulator